MQTYDEGFADGLKWVARCLRQAAVKAAATKRSTFTDSKSGNMVDAVARVGDAAFAAKLRDVAQVIEAAAGTLKSQ